MPTEVVKAYETVASYLVEQDETLRAIELLRNHVPAFDRDNKNHDLHNLEKLICSKIFTVQDYMRNKDDEIHNPNVHKGYVDSYARGVVLRDRLRNANAEGITPHIIDMGPGEYWLPIGLNQYGFKFTYTAIGLHDGAHHTAKNLLEHLWVDRTVTDRPVWFVAYEIIEHLYSSNEIRTNYDRLKTDADKVFLSTPMYTFNEGNPQWKERGCPHLKAYTPSEFMMEAQHLFKGYNWTFINDPVMVLIGEK